MSVTQRKRKLSRVSYIIVHAECSHLEKLDLIYEAKSLYQGIVRDDLYMGVYREVNDVTLISACKDTKIHDFIPRCHKVM